VRERIDHWLNRFDLDVALRPHVAEVFFRLPKPVLDDLMTDPAFVLCDYEPSPVSTSTVLLKMSGRGKPGRSVVLKRTLRRRPEAFVRWVIAHELAHAHLRNGGRWPNDDPEIAADSLAADWGFPKPRDWRFA
jgi:hypothetical protein